MVSVKLRTGVTVDLPNGLFINNQFVPALGGGTIDTYDPYTGSLIASVSAAESADVDVAVKAAEEAHPTWRKVAGPTRAKLLWRLADLIERDLDILAALEAMDNGKAYQIAKGDVRMAADTLRYYAGWCDKHYGQTVDMGESSLNYTRHEPIGVVGQIIPWNFPLLIWTWKIAPSVACGNVSIIKSAEQTPLTALYAAQLVKEAGFLPGVINVLSGLGRTAGAAMAAHPRIRKIAFTGSTPVGRMIMKTAAESNLKRVTLELGGKSPHIVFADAEMDKAVESVAMGIFFNHGQNCCAGSRAFVQSSIYDKFIAALQARIQTINLGDPFADQTFQGPQVSKIQFDRIMTLVNDGLSSARLVTGGKQHSLGGFFIEPTIFADVQADSKLHEEIFGPVLCVHRFDSVEEVVSKANDTEFGLASGLHTTNLNTAIHVANALEAGVVWVNQYGGLPAQLPMGGYKQSGIGRDLGSYALAEYTQVKTVQIGLSIAH